MTSLTKAEFETLLEETENVFQQKMKTQKVNGQKREHRKYTDYKNSSFNNKQDRLLLALVYLKQNSTQEVLANLFEVTQPKINIWLHAVLPCIQQALKNLNCTPARNNEALQKLIEHNDSPLFHKMEPKGLSQDQ
jgi:ABC-type methionine transport system ATPase subunit